MIYERIKSLCKLNGITIRRLEVMAGLANGCIAGWKTKTPRVTTLKKVADYFGITVDELLK